MDKNRFLGLMVGVGLVVVAVGPNAVMAAEDKDKQPVVGLPDMPRDGDAKRDANWVKDHPRVPGEAKEEAQYRSTHQGVASEVNRLEAGGAPTKTDAKWAATHPTARKEIRQHEQFKRQNPGAVKEMKQDRRSVGADQHTRSHAAGGARGRRR